MCGISGIISKSKNLNLVDHIVRLNEAIKHRGPDGEGFLISDFHSFTPCFRDKDPGFSRTDLPYVPKQHLVRSENTQLAFGHRRLAIIDLSDSGHQPMCNSTGTNWIVFNGEIYNYLELRHELKQLGRTFMSQSDTEVILHAYDQWGADCVKRFNGMWAFCIYDHQRNICFASRDRLGVKPFYYINTSDVFAFASEQKALVKAGLVSAEINENDLYNYLINGLLEYEESNFFKGILELWPGDNLIYDLTTGQTQSSPYYRIDPSLQNDTLSEHALIEKIGNAFDQAVRLRLRSDVEVGTCLSGGIDSSALAVSIAELTNKPLHCFTSVFKNHQTINEEHFADLVAGKISARYHKVEPTLEGLLNEIDDLVYSQDVPIWSSSTYAQYKVMELSKLNNIKVVLDGQGADELFGGYHHHFVAQWNGFLKEGHYSQFFAELTAAKKTFNRPALFYAKEKIKSRRAIRNTQLKKFFKEDYLHTGEILKPVYYDSVNDQLMDDIYRTRLKSFLKCEDRCGMWHSVESRTPFSDDVDLINLMFSFDGSKKIKNGISKYLLREAVKQKLPEEIYTRYDKKGFQTPMQQWVKSMRSLILDELKTANFSFINYQSLQHCKLEKAFEYELFFKLFVLCRWKQIFSSKTI